MPTALQNLLRASRQGQQPEPSGPNILRKIGSAVLSPLAMAGNILDLPGSSVRDVLTGKNPFDQYGSKWWEDAGNRSSGRDVLAAHGLASENDPQRWEAADVGGFITELATDPLTWVSGGVSGLGKALQGTGKATHLFRVGIPFTKSGVNVGAGAAKLLDKAAGKAWKSAVGETLSTAGNRLFNYAAQGAETAADQAFQIRKTKALENAMPAAKIGAQEDFDTLAKPLTSFMSDAPGADQDAFHRLVQMTGETTGRELNDADFAKSLTKAMGQVTKGTASPELRETLQQAVGTMKSKQNQLRERLVGLGVPVGEIDRYFPRSASADYIATKQAKFGDRAATRANNTLSRKALLRDIPGEIINALSEDTSGKYRAANGVSAGQAAQNILNDFGEYFTGYSKRSKVTGEMLDFDPAKQAEHFAKFLADKKAMKIMETDAVKNHTAFVEGMTRLAETTDQMYRHLAENLGEGGVKLGKVFARAKLDKATAFDNLAKITGKSVGELQNLTVPLDVAKSLFWTKKAHTNPGPIGKAFDWFNKWFKTNVTIPFPSYHMRNLLGGQYVNLTSGYLDAKDFASTYPKAMAEANRLRKAPANDKLLRELEAYGVVNPYQAAEVEQLPYLSNSLGGNPLDIKQNYADAQKYVSENPRLLDKIPGGKRLRTAGNTYMSGAAKTAQATEWYNRVPMYLALKAKGYAPKEAADIVEKLHVNYSKLSDFEKGVMRRGIPFYAFQSRMIPLTLQTLAERPGGLMAQSIKAGASGRDDNEVLPSYIAGQAAIPMNQLADGTKRYITGLGMPTETSLPYLTAPLDPKGAGLDLLAAASPLLKGPLEMATGQTFFQRGPSGGRELSDLDPTLARTAGNITQLVTGDKDAGNELVARARRSPTWMAAEHFAANTPLTKYMGTARTITDPRKMESTVAGVPANVSNVTFPWRVTDVSPQQQERLLQQASNVLADELGAKTWTNRYFPKDMIERAKRDDPRAAAQMEQLNALLSQFKKNAKKYQDRKKKKPDTPRAGNRAGNLLSRLAGV